MTAQARISYPTKAVIERTIAAARASGIDVAGYKVSPRGEIEVFEARAAPQKSKNDFDLWEGEL